MKGWCKGGSPVNSSRSARPHPPVGGSRVQPGGPVGASTTAREVGDRTAGLPRSRPSAPDVALIDLRTPVMDGGAATAEIVGGPSATGRLVVTAYDTDVGIERAVEGGAIGYLVKGTTRDQLVRAIRSAARGETVLAPRVAHRLAARMRQPAPMVLTARERDALSDATSANGW
ncbi:response regulator receiver domain-containing protein [Streptomyces sp. KS 21]|nr:response regulator receiver domain-containing protein [Streptomyces sp. KS 21]